MASNKYLKYDFELGEYVWVDYDELPAGPSISPDQYTVPVPTSADGMDTQGFASPQGDVFGAAAAFDAFSTGLDVVSAGSPVGVAVAAATSIGDMLEGFERADKLSAAARPDANINELLGGYQAKATIGDVIGNVAAAAFGAFTGNVIGTIGGLVGVASDISSIGLGNKALEQAAAMEQELAQTGMVAGKPASYGFGYANTVSNFQDMQAKNLAAVSRERTTSLAPGTPGATIGQALEAATGATGGFSGYSAGFSDLSFGGFSSGTHGSTGSMGGYEAGATNPGAAGSLGGEGAGAGDVGGGFSGGGMSGGFGSGDTGSASETGADVGGGNIA